MEATKNADLDECFNEFDDDNQENRQLEIHLSGGVFQSKIFLKPILDVIFNIFSFFNIYRS